MRGWNVLLCSFMQRVHGVELLRRAPPPELGGRTPRIEVQKFAHLRPQLRGEFVVGHRQARQRHHAVFHALQQVEVPGLLSLPAQRDRAAAPLRAHAQQSARERVRDVAAAMQAAIPQQPQQQRVLVFPAALGRGPFGASWQSSRICPAAYVPC